MLLGQLLQMMKLDVVIMIDIPLRPAHILTLISLVFRQ